ncbi:L-glutamate gamma-semialdehyde dehydrogenase [Myxococcota bacterium]|nr:L-glutamate gamma-semialdehyde dehydrogenase [Myxococcota bacterium]
MIAPFQNEPLTDFSRTDLHQAQQAAIARVEASFGRSIPLRIGGKEITTSEAIFSRNPSNPSEVVARVSKATPEQAAQAVEAAHQAFQSWSRWEPAARARVLLRAAAILRRRRFEANALMILEAGKPWVEADADTAEAIDFLEFYAREAMRYGEPQPVTTMPGEEDNLYYLPCGVTVVIPPWNFPLAITTGMTTAALVAGNTVVLKPASPTPAIAWLLVEVLREAGLPDEVLNYCPGSGGTMGDALVAHPKTRIVAFTGSMAVGLHINELAAKAQPGQIWIKRVIAEMGGKDAIVVADDADLDEAAAGVVASAFGYQGQKCSACSRLIVMEAVHDALVERVVDLTRKITVGPSKDPANRMGPVITDSAMATIQSYIDVGRSEGRLLTGGGRLDAPGYFLEPTVFDEVAPQARIAQEEIFGPVLACTRARDYDDALAIANGTVYGLTGAVYSRSRERLERARREFHVGNLYLNRKCTGAMVSAHPFGGFNLSGTDSKAGGRDYLLLFLQAKSVAERF